MTEPTIAQKLAAISTLAEIEGFAYGLKLTEQDTPDNLRLVATRRYEIQKRMGHRK